MKVQIYTETTIKGPAIKAGKYAAIVEYKKQSGEIEKREVVNEEKWTTFHRTSLLAVLAGMNMLIKRCEVTVYTADALLVGMVREGNIEKWKRAEWKRGQDKEVKNKDLWQQLDEALKKHDVAFVYTKQNAHSEELKEAMKL